MNRRDSPTLAGPVIARIQANPVARAAA